MRRLLLLCARHKGCVEGGCERAHMKGRHGCGGARRLRLLLEQELLQLEVCGGRCGGRSGRLV